MSIIAPLSLRTRRSANFCALRLQRDCEFLATPVFGSLEVRQLGHLVTDPTSVFISSKGSHPVIPNREDS